MNTYICVKKTRDCPKLCPHSRPHSPSEEYMRFLNHVNEEVVRVCKCSDVEFKCEWWKPHLFTTCKLYDGGTGDLFEEQNS